MLKLDGKVALVTGCGTRGEGWGNGKAIAVLLARQGATVFGVDRDIDAAKVTQQIIQEEGGKAHVTTANVTIAQDVQHMVRSCMDMFGRIDILINNVGQSEPGGPVEMSEDIWDGQMDLNVKSLFFLTQALHPQMKAAATFDRPGKVINIASIDGLRINPWQTYSYQASKAAVIHLTRRLAAELVKDNILVSGIAPGAFQSDMNKAARDHAEAVGKNIPFPRIGTPEDMAGLAIFLAARAGDYIVGETIACDGGIVNASLPGNGIAP
jgi:NAD(P)-dependent dehydrogenase (short-subunit alcohol dehydrogenase family)